MEFKIDLTMTAMLKQESGEDCVQTDSTGLCTAGTLPVPNCSHAGTLASNFLVFLVAQADTDCVDAEKFPSLKSNTPFLECQSFKLTNTSESQTY